TATPSPFAGEGWGGGSSPAAASVPLGATPSPNPSPRAGEEALLQRDQTLGGTHATAGCKFVPLSEIATDSLIADVAYASPHRPSSSGAHAAHVAVDPATGHVEVLDYVAVEDVGRIINPAMLHGQTIGAIVQGLGGTFLEHLIYDEHGQLLTGSLA